MPKTDSPLSFEKSPYELMHFHSIQEDLKLFPWREGRHILFDFETTGLETESARIIQIAGILSKEAHNDQGFIVLDTFNTLVNPGFQISEETTEITKITQEMLDSAPALDEPVTPFGETILDQFMAFLDQAMMIGGHNVVKYDLPILKNEMARTDQVYELNIPVFDTLIWARYQRGHKRSNTNLRKMSQRYGVSIASDVISGKKSAHNALVDVQLNTGLFWIFAEKVMTAWTLKDLMREQLSHLIAQDTYDQKYKR